MVALDPELRNSEKVILRRVGKVDDAHLIVLGFAGSILIVNPNAIADQRINPPVGDNR